jgi:hypothetical protein
VGRWSTRRYSEEREDSDAAGYSEKRILMEQE